MVLRTNQSKLVPNMDELIQQLTDFFHFCNQYRQIAVIVAFFVSVFILRPFIETLKNSVKSTTSQKPLNRYLF